MFGPVHDQGEKYRGSTVDMEGQGIVTFGRLVQGGGAGWGKGFKCKATCGRIFKKHTHVPDLFSALYACSVAATEG